MMSPRTRPPGPPPFTPDHDRHPPGALAALSWYAERMRSLLPVLLVIAGAIGFVAYTAPTRLAVLEARVSAGEADRQRIRAEIDSAVAAVRADASADRQLLVGVARFACITAPPRDIGILGLPCQTLLGRRPEAP